MIILGIDPGFINTGFSVLFKNGNKISLLDFGILNMKVGQSIAVRIACFYDFFNKKLSDYDVKVIAIETPFLGKNPQNFLKLGYLRGILYLLSNKHNVNLLEFAPREIKLAITGFGGASKEQVSRVLLKIFPSLKSPSKFDLTDSIAISLCGLWNTSYRGINL